MWCRSSRSAGACCSAQRGWAQCSTSMRDRLLIVGNNSSPQAWAVVWSSDRPLHLDDLAVCDAHIRLRDVKLRAAGKRSLRFVHLLIGKRNEPARDIINRSGQHFNRGVEALLGRNVDTFVYLDHARTFFFRRPLAVDETDAES